MFATGASRAATGTITANTDSTLTLPNASSQVVITNASAVPAYIRLNGAVSTTLHDFILAAGGRAYVEDVMVETVHVYMDATAGLRVVYW